ncbi:MAG TPA: ATP-binding cassette domain-containing protein [Gaiellales bacterium]|jgi:energy-coupling factor transporter ATP-binding protein EcfA2|nr:ATP-binding cassette domain-containing protein [Gaiellales bacterium]
MAALSFQGVGHRYPGGHRPALQSIDLEIEAGELVLVVGESGCGKSTLLRAALGLVPHFHGGELHGRVRIAGRDTRDTRPGELARHAGLVFQDPESQVVMRRVLADVAFGPENLGAARDAILPQARAALGMVGAGRLEGRETRSLSGGERQRVAIAGVLAMGQRILLLDEPTSQLDPGAADALVAALIDLRDRHGVTVVVAEHRTERLFPVADRVVALRDGRVWVDGTPSAAEAALAPSAPWLLPRPPAAAPGPPAPTGDGVRVDGACKRLGDTDALHDVTAAFPRGRVTAVTGPNGAGKTTLALAACGLLPLDRGAVTRSGRAGYVAQDPACYLLHDTAAEEVEYGLRNLGVPAAERAARAAAELNRLGLAWAAGRHPRDLSSGERQRLAIASVTAMQPDLLVLDEPTRGVDGRRRSEIAAIVRTLAAGGAAVVIVSHDAGFVAEAAEAAVRLTGGRVDAGELNRVEAAVA